MRRRAAPDRWTGSPERSALLALYAEVDALLEGWSCACSRAGVGGAPEAASGAPFGPSARLPARPQCCHFAVTGREPYPTAVELKEVRHAIRARGITPRDPRKLPMADLGACPLLSAGGRCGIYESRPFGCRTFFCDHAEGPMGAKPRLPRDAVNELGRRVADLSARFAPRDPRPRPLVRALMQPRPSDA